MRRVEIAYDDIVSVRKLVGAVRDRHIVHGDGRIGVVVARERAVRDYLAERELVSYAYFETHYPVELLCEGPGQGESRGAICYILDRSHFQYAGDMDPDQQADIIARAIGPSGPNVDYLMNTLDKLHELGIGDPALEEMADKVRARRAP